MTKPMNRLILIFAVFLSGCAFQSDINESNIRESIVGSWSRESKGPLSYEAERLTLNADGSGRFKNATECLVFEESGKWFLTGNLLQIEVSGSKDPRNDRSETYKITALTPRKLNLQDPTHGYTITFERK